MVGEGHPVLLFDGVCHFCSNTVNFVIRHDKAGKVHFAPLQSDYGQARLKEAGLPTEGFDSLVFIENEQVYTRSTGALKLAKYLDGAWKILYGLRIIPAPIRNAIYDFIAKNRYKWFGKSETCMMPTSEIRARFIG